MPPRPLINIPYTKRDWLLEMIAFVSTLVPIAIIAFTYQDLPAQIPIHFNVLGEVDHWGPKISLLLLPFISLSLYLVLTFVSRFPEKFNYPKAITPENARHQYTIARLLILSLKTHLTFFFGLIIGIVVRLAQSKVETPSLMLSILLVFVGSNLGITASFFYRLRKG